MRLVTAFTFSQPPARSVHVSLSHYRGESDRTKQQLYLDNPEDVRYGEILALIGNMRFVYSEFDVSDSLVEMKNVICPNEIEETGIRMGITELRTAS